MYRLSVNVCTTEPTRIFRSIPLPVSVPARRNWRVLHSSWALRVDMPYLHLYANLKPGPFMTFSIQQLFVLALSVEPSVEHNIQYRRPTIRAASVHAAVTDPGRSCHVLTPRA